MSIAFNAAQSPGHAGHDWGGSGDYALDATIAVAQDDAGREHPLTLVQQWPVRQPFPISERLAPTIPPYYRPARILDTFFRWPRAARRRFPVPLAPAKR
ncbi:MAG: hypothetical protein R2911_05665 [Caldilineaceae bacterium]